ncbi:MAG: LuxR C-terminal-related transcriptional regulator [Anaeromicrobium sp.]|jgi:DNA-binding NarL/FixJ family response regulator|uniref:response regulator transcription factor n=1 Tax=Anaeromicrobium sp. TaxID=1929132 RepID=UPI0025FFEFEF|nr:LuxR C-terminal-related transcriptional regulator [Anaeromicrobium sp.]MCT4594023.1 LuxR C-terminal-related transcriptional regulator [Anaeromicrobium sp.]
MIKIIIADDQVLLRKSLGQIISTDKEIDVVHMVGTGKEAIKEIGKIFNYTEGTIKNKVSRIYEKLGISDRLRLAVYAVENGIG